MLNVAYKAFFFVSKVSYPFEKLLTKLMYWDFFLGYNWTYIKGIRLLILITFEKIVL